MKGEKAIDSYGTQVTILEIKGDIVTTTKGVYHAANLFIDGESVKAILDRQKEKV